MTRSSDPPLARLASWAVLAASFGLSASTWDGLAKVAGFTGTVANTGFYLSWLLPVAADGYIVVALVLWTSDVSSHVSSFAKRNTYAGASASIVAQACFHGLVASEEGTKWWSVPVAIFVGMLAPSVAALGVHMRAMLRADLRALQTAPLQPVVQVAEPEYSQVVTFTRDEELQPEVQVEVEPQRILAPAGDLAVKAHMLRRSGMTIKEIAAVLKRSERTVHTYLRQPAATQGA